MYNWEKYRGDDDFYYLESLNVERSEYFIALYYVLVKYLEHNYDTTLMVEDAIEENIKCDKIKNLIPQINIDVIRDYLKRKKISCNSVYLYHTEYSNVLPEISINGTKLVVNTSTIKRELTVDAKSVLPKEQLKIVKNELLPDYAEDFLDEMESEYRDPRKWFLRNKPSQVKAEFLERVSSIVVDNWSNLSLVSKKDVLAPLISDDSEDIMTINFEDGGMTIANPNFIKSKDVSSVSIEKYGHSRMMLTIGDKQLAIIEPCFAKDFLDTVYNKEGKRTSKKANFIYKNIEMVYGNPFGKWRIKFC